MLTFEDELSLDDGLSRDDGASNDAVPVPGSDSNSYAMGPALDHASCVFPGRCCCCPDFPVSAGGGRIGVPALDGSAPGVLVPVVLGLAFCELSEPAVVLDPEDSVRALYRSRDFRAWCRSSSDCVDVGVDVFVFVLSPGLRVGLPQSNDRRVSNDGLFDRCSAIIPSALAPGAGRPMRDARPGSAQGMSKELLPALGVPVLEPPGLPVIDWPGDGDFESCGVPGRKSREFRSSEILLSPSGVGPAPVCPDREVGGLVSGGDEGPALAVGNPPAASAGTPSGHGTSSSCGMMQWRQPRRPQPLWHRQPMVVHC